MGRKLSDIKNTVDNSSVEFLDYLRDNLQGSNFDLLQKISKKTNVIIFSGVIRNFFLKKSDIRDLDIVLKEKVNIEDIFKDATEIRRNSFGGYKININSLNFDIWYLRDTWALNYQKSFDFGELEKLMPNTAFFNFSSIVFSFNEKKFFYSKSFLSFLRYKEIDVVYKPNMHYKLCVVNTFYYSKKYNLKISKELFSFIRHIHISSDGDYKEIQIKHFGKVLFSNEDLAYNVLNEVCQNNIQLA